MRQPHIAAIVCAFIIATGTVSAQTRPETQSNRAAAQPAPALSSKPYSRLFAQQLAPPSAAHPSTVRPGSARRFICGMPVLPADAAIDPKFEMRPRDTTTRFSMWVVAPGQCH